MRGDKSFVRTASLAAKFGKSLQPVRNGLRGAAQFRGRTSTALLQMGRTLREAEAAELLEFALAIPLILVMVVGLLDFANAYHTKQALANAAREGSRLGAAAGRSDITQTSPTSVQNIHDAVVAYLQNAGISTTFIGSTASTCVTSGNPNGFCWDYNASGSYGLRVERSVILTNTDSNSTTLYATRVTLLYPYNWTFGFNHVITLLIPSATAAGTIGIQADAMMVDQ